MMDIKRIEEELKKHFDYSAHVPLNDSYALKAFEHIAKIVRNETLERAAISAWSTGMDEHHKHQGLPYDCREIGSIAAKNIRSLKDETI
jgi:hypothetical protein